MSKYRIVQYKDRYEVEEKYFKFVGGGGGYFPREKQTWVKTIGEFKTLRQARKFKDELELTEGKIIE